jgi:hypothetical protein
MGEQLKLSRGGIENTLHDLVDPLPTQFPGSADQVINSAAGITGCGIRGLNIPHDLPLFPALLAEDVISVGAGHLRIDIKSVLRLCLFGDVRSLGVGIGCQYLTDGFHLAQGFSVAAFSLRHLDLLLVYDKTVRNPEFRDNELFI